MESPIIKLRVILRNPLHICKSKMCSYHSQMGTPAIGRSAPSLSDLQRLMFMIGVGVESAQKRKKL
jgi:hypothetical protein